MKYIIVHEKRRKRPDLNSGWIDFSTYSNKFVFHFKPIYDKKREYRELLKELTKHIQKFLIENDYKILKEKLESVKELEGEKE